jgi:hypothetical protein
MNWIAVAGGAAMVAAGFAAGWAISDWKVAAPLKLKLLTSEREWAEERRVASEKLAEQVAAYRTIEKETVEAFGVLAAGRAEKEMKLEKARADVLAGWPGRLRQRPAAVATGVPGTTDGADASPAQACEDRLPGIREAYEDVAAETRGAAAALVDAQQLLADFDYVVAVAESCPAFRRP